MVEQSLIFFTEAIKWLPSLLLLWGLIWISQRPYVLLEPQGKLKRGICIYRERLPEEYLRFLHTFEGDIYEIDEVLEFKLRGAFIRRVADEVLIVASPRTKSQFLFYVGYVCLTSDEPQIEYRTSRVRILFLSLFILLLSVLIVTIPLFWYVFRSELKQEQVTIRQFLQDCIAAQENGTPLIRNVFKLGYNSKRGLYRA